MSLDDLLKGLAGFQEGVQSLAVSQGINKAQEQVAQLNSQMLKETERRQALSQISNNLVLQLSQAGANPQQVAQAAGAIAPPAIKDGNDAFLQGLQTNSQELMDMGRAANNEATRGQREMQDASLDAQKGNLLISTHSNEKIAGMNNDARLRAGEAKAGELPRPAFDRFSKAMGDRQTLVELLHNWKSSPEMQKYVGLLAKDPGGARKYFNENMAAFQAEVNQAFNEYRKSITGAAASEQELAALREALFNIDNSPAAFEKILKRTLAVSDAKFKAQLKPYEKAGRDISMFDLDQDSLIPTEAPAATAPKTLGVQSRQAPMTPMQPQGAPTAPAPKYDFKKYIGE